MFSDWLNAYGLAAGKPYIVECLLPPVPFIALALAGAVWLPRRRRAGWAILLLGCTGLWLSQCDGAGAWIERHVLQAPAALAAADRAGLRAREAEHGDVAIVVLGGGVMPASAEYGGDDLNALSLQRLRYGVWLGRETGIPVAMSGGLGWLQQGGQARGEAELGARIAAREFGAPLRWIEASSRDTRENARDTVALLAPQGVREIVVVTHAWHITRALREFRAAAATRPEGLQIVAAPIETGTHATRPILNWLPSGQGALRTRAAVRDALGLLLAP